ncbi:MAG: Ig-like domain-containing protein, partial [Fimbriimonadales bacterium]
MAFERTKRIISALALTGISSLALAEWQAPRQTPLIQKGASNTIRLQFRGFQPASVEVVIDGVIVASRAVSRGQSELQIGLRSLGLAPGAHEATVRYYDAQGRLIGEMRTPVDIEPDPSAPISIILPRNSATVSGTVPIEVRLNQSGQQYVTFFVNGQVRALRNFPPYLFAWDTTQEPNGVHTLEAQVFNGSQTFRTPQTRVRVNNPGGRTDRQLSEQPESANTVVQPEPSALNEPSLSTAQAPMTLAYGSLRSAPPAESRPVEEARLSLPSGTSTRPIELPAQPSSPEANPPSLRSVEPNPVLSPNRLSSPVEEPHLAPGTAPIATEEGTLRSAEAEPFMRGQKLQIPRIASAPTSTPASKSAPAEKGWLPIELGARLPKGVETFEVALDA